MELMLESLTLGQIDSVEKVVYNSDYNFTDDQFKEFIEQQLEFGVDAFKIELQDDIIYIYEDVYFFEDLIARGEYELI